MKKDWEKLQPDKLNLKTKLLDFSKRSKLKTKSFHPKIRSFSVKLPQAICSKKLFWNQEFNFQILAVWKSKPKPWPVKEPSVDLLLINNFLKTKRTKFNSFSFSDSLKKSIQQKESQLKKLTEHWRPLPLAFKVQSGENQLIPESEDVRQRKITTDWKSNSVLPSALSNQLWTESESRFHHSDFLLILKSSKCWGITRSTHTKWLEMFWTSRQFHRKQ